MDSPHKGQWRGALKFSLAGAWPNDWANNRDACDLRRRYYGAHYEVTVIIMVNTTADIQLYTNTLHLSFVLMFPMQTTHWRNWFIECSTCFLKHEVILYYGPLDVFSWWFIYVRIWYICLFGRGAENTVDTVSIIIMNNLISESYGLVLRGFYGFIYTYRICNTKQRAC